jgi:hypothetical protein
MKTILILSILAILVPPKAHKHGTGESEADARARYEVIATAIEAEAVDDVSLASFLMAVARHESTLRRDIHSGKARGDGGHSWSLYQLNCGPRSDAVVPGTKYRAREIVGVDLASTKRATHAAAVHLRKAIRACKGGPLCVFKRYGGVSRTMAKDSKVKARLEARVKTYRRIRAEHRARSKE